jgi:acyl-CoA synthetase (NDP forming)
MPVAIEDALFRPRGIAIVGASNDPAKLSGRPLEYLLRLGYGGGIYPVNPTREKVQGVTAYATLSKASGPIDLAIVVLPAPAVAAALRDCAAAGVTAAIVFASGFAEMGGVGRARQDEVENIVKSTGLRVIGPNCLGTFGLPTAAFATFSSAFDEGTEFPDDPFALVSQSGAVGTFIYATMVSEGLGVRYYANTGNEADVTVAELLGALAKAEDVDVLIGYLEDARRLNQLEDTARTARRLGKPLILLKSGVTAAGARAVKFHTASTPGSDEEFDAVVKRHGAIRVESMEAACDTALLFRAARRAAGRRLAIVTSSGGASALATDAAVRLGLEVNELGSEIRAEIAAMLPEYGSALNPVDLTGALLTDPALIGRALSRVMQDPDVDMILIVIGNADRGADALVDHIHQACESTRKPFAVAWSGGSGRPRSALRKLRVPAYSEPLRALRAMARLADYSSFMT